MDATGESYYRERPNDQASRKIDNRAHRPRRDLSTLTRGLEARMKRELPTWACWVIATAVFVLAIVVAGGGSAVI